MRVRTSPQLLHVCVDVPWIVIPVEASGLKLSIQSVDFVIDATDAGRDTKELAKKRLQMIFDEAKHRKANKPRYRRLAVIYASAPSVQDSRTNNWRCSHNDFVLKGSPHVTGIVINYGLTFGHESSLVDSWLTAAAVASETNKPLSICPVKDSELSLIHLDDLVDLYSIAIDKAHLCRGQVLDTSTTIEATPTKLIWSKIQELSKLKSVTIEGEYHTFFHCDTVLTIFASDREAILCSAVRYCRRKGRSD
jgi:hypothetical protein